MSQDNCNPHIKGHSLNAETAVFMCCDIQEAFRKHIVHFDAMVDVARRLVEATTLLDIPLMVSEQYPKGLGTSVHELKIPDAINRYPKTDFTMIAVPEIKTDLLKLNVNGTNSWPSTVGVSRRNQVVLFGLETHVCIQQTALDLLQLGFEVFIIADACSSRSQDNRIFAIRRLEQAGCVITTYESVLLQLVGSKDHPKFKAVQDIIRSLPPDSGLVSAMPLSHL